MRRNTCAPDGASVSLLLLPVCSELMGVGIERKVGGGTVIGYTKSFVVYYIFGRWLLLRLLFRRLLESLRAPAFFRRFTLDFGITSDSFAQLTGL